jgi:stearoyl-CoA desaturase (delta-9 desaturase)
LADDGLQLAFERVLDVVDHAIRDRTITPEGGATIAGASGLDQHHCVLTGRTMMPLRADQGVKRLPLDWRNICLLTFVHVVALGGLAVYIPARGLPRPVMIAALVLTVSTIFAVSAGYHRLFSHRAYEAHRALRFLLLALGAGAFQNSALVWAANHRRHHSRTDSDIDPYNAGRGFWYSHIGWIVRKPDPRIQPVPVPDLERDPLVAWQHRHYALISVAVGVGLPVLLGLAVGDLWGGFIVGGAARLVLVYHATFSINSFAHRFGSQPYSDNNSSRDNVLTALFSMGEGYHNFHHTFPADYRNGVEPHQFDPTKWVLWTLAWLGVVRSLRRTPPPAIVRARLRMDERRLAAQELPQAARQHLQQLRVFVDDALTRWHELVAQYQGKRNEATEQARQVLASLRVEMRAVGRDVRGAYARWKRLVRSPGEPISLSGNWG